MKISAYFSLFFLIFLQIQSAFSVSWNGWEIKELDVDSSFATDITNNWYISNYRVASRSYQCGTVYLMGGYYVLGDAAGNNYGAYLQRYFNGLPIHSMIRFSMTFYALDNWNEKGFDIQLDNLRIIPGLTLYQSNFASDVCGSSSYKDATDLIVVGAFTHQKSDLYFSIISRLSSTSNTRSFGIRDFSMIFDNNPPVFLQPLLPELFCAIGGTTATPKCKCPATQYNDTANNCQDCHKACSSCYGPTASQCFACKPGYSWNGLECIACHSTCDTCTGGQSSQCMRCVAGRVKFTAGGTCPQDCPFPLTKSTSNGIDYCAVPCAGIVYWDGTCGACAFPLQQKTILGSVTLCIYPCSPGEYLYWDGTCQAGCPSPLTVTITKGYKFCTHACATITNFLYPDGLAGSCSATCTAPLQAKIIQGRKLCVSPCAQSTDYLYWNGECLSTCPTTTLYTTTTLLGVNYCNYPCTGLNYRFWDSTCSLTCASPLVPTVSRGQLFCNYPTATADYLYWDGTSNSGCNSPLTPTTAGAGASLRRYCGYPCNIYEYLRWDGTCLLHCNAPYVRRLQWGRRFCDSPCTGTNSLFWDGTCRASSTCMAPVTLNTYGTKTVCTFPVGNYSQYLYWDGSFGATCPLPYTPYIDGTNLIRKFCKNSCAGGTPNLKWDGTCISGCPTPGSLVTVKTKPVCRFPCALPQFYDWNLACVDTCNYPKVTVVEGSGQYCNHPCGATTTDFYYWNSTCYSTCDIPLTQVTIDSINWCVYTCEATQYLYTNGTCSELCEDPFAIKVEGNLNFCFNPCSPTEALFWNGTCFPQTACSNSPMSIVTTTMGLICQTPCQPLEFYDLATKTCITECDTESIIKMELYLVCKRAIPEDTTTFLDMWVNAPNSSVATLVTPIRMLQYARYLDINFPPRLQRMLATKGSPILTFRFGKDMSSELRSTFPMYDLPEVFSQYKFLHSNFIVNFWKEMLSWLIVAAIIVGLVAINQICQRYNFEKALPITEKLVTVFKWNLMLILIAMSVPDIIVYSSLQLRTIHFSSKFAGISLELAVLMIGVLAMLFTGAAYLSSGLRKAKDTQLDEPQAEFFDKWKGYQTIFRGYKDEKSFNLMFYLIYLFRFSLPMLIASYLYMVPVLQGILYVWISLLITGYILWMRPLIKFINFLQLLIMETIMLIINICLFSLIALDLSGDSTSDSFVMLGDFVVGGNSLINLLFIVMFLLKIAAAVVRAFSKNKTGEDWLKGDWIEIFPIFFQQIGFGFEDISPDPKADFILDQGLLVTKKGVDAKSRAEEAYKKKSRLGAGNEEKETEKKEGWMTKLKKAIIGTPKESNMKAFNEVIHFEAPVRKSTVGVDLLSELANRRPETPASETIESEPIDTEPQEDQNRLEVFKRVDQQRVLTIKDMLPKPKVEERAWTPGLEKEVIENEDRERNQLAYLARKGVFKEEEEANKLMVGRVPDRRKTKAETEMFNNPNYLGITGADARKVDLRNIEENDDE